MKQPVSCIISFDDKPSSFLQNTYHFLQCFVRAFHMLNHERGVDLVESSVFERQPLVFDITLLNFRPAWIQIDEGSSVRVLAAANVKNPLFWHSTHSSFSQISVQTYICFVT